MVVLDALDTHRLKGPGTDMQGDVGGCDALLSQRSEHGLVEMEARSGCSDGTGALRVNGLITLPVAALVGPIYIRRQRHMTDALEQRQNGLAKAQLEKTLLTPQDLRLATAVDEDAGAGLWRLAGTHMSQHTLRVQHTLYQYLELAARGLAPEQPRRNDPRIVEHHQIARPHIVKQISKAAMTKGTARPFENEETAGAALGKRIASDQRFGKLKKEIGDLHNDRVGNGAQSLAETHRADHGRRLTLTGNVPILRRLVPRWRNR